MTDLHEMYSLYASLGFEQTFTDILAILKNNPRETAYNFDVSQIRSKDIIPAKSLSLNLEQMSTYPTRLAGEGAESSTFQVGVRKSRANANIPVLIPTEGWVDPVIGTLWDLCKQARWGSATAAIGRMISPTNDDPITASQSEIYTDNIADFLTFVLPLELTIVPQIDSGEEFETVRIIDINKSERKLILEHPTLYIHSPNDTLLVYLPQFTGPEREPDFSLMSLQEGMLTPCLVNKITLEATDVKMPIDFNVEFAFLHTFRKAQIDIKSARQQLINQLSLKPIGRLTFGSEMTISSTTTSVGTFGLGPFIDNELVDGFQGKKIQSITITGMNITIDNRLTDTHTLHSLSTTIDKRHDDNNHPLGLTSEGRVISGKITYKSTLEPWAVLERLCGSSSINHGGLTINFGSFKIVMNQIAWTPSKSNSKIDGDIERVLEWTMLAENYDDMPRLEYANQI